MEVSSETTSVSIDTPGFMTSITPDGAMSRPSATPADTQQDVIDAAPMSSLGEVGAPSTSKKDSKAKVEAFKAHVSDSKSELGDLGEAPDYGQLHEVSLMQDSQSSAEGEHAEASDSGAAGNSSGGEGRDTGSSDSGESEHY